jgi:hypothetical protein
MNYLFPFDVVNQRQRRFADLLYNENRRFKGSHTELLAVNRMSSKTPRNGRKIGSFSGADPSLYSRANVEAACVAATASTSHRALLMEAAAAKRADKVGKDDTINVSARRPPIPAPARDSKGNSTMAAVAAAQRPLKAEVNGRIAAERAP